MRYFAAILLLICSGCGKAPTLEESYSGPWGNPTSDVMVTLAKNGVMGCGEFYQKESKSDQGEYAVASNRTPSGEAAWELYLVWPQINQVTGPDPTGVYKVGGPPHVDPR